jgi:2-dehydropantoate 2-reductase
MGGTDVRILVVGAGATGGFFGGRLAQAGRDVTFLVRPGRASVLRERGLRIVGGGERTVIEPKLVLAGELDGPFDVILVGVKAAGLDAAVADLAPAVGQDSRIVPMLNGMRHVDVLAARFGERALGGVVKVMTTIDENGDIARLGELSSMSYGSLDGRPDPRLDAVHAAFGDAGFDASVCADIVGEMWSKWVFIASVGAVTCLMRGTIGEVNAVAGGSGFAEAVVGECAAVAAAAGHPVPDAELKVISATVTTQGSPHTSSAYRDLVAGRPVEAEQIFGDLVARARRFGVPTPLLDLTTLHMRVHQHRVEGR